METIAIRNLLPNVFRGMEGSARIKASAIWSVPEFTFRRGCRLCVRAESGGGKSSLLSFIFGNRRDYQGDILFDGESARGLSVEQWCDIRTTKIALLPQEMRLFPELSVAQNINLKNNRTGHKAASEIETMLQRLGIADKRDTQVGSLSIGQQQRVAAARALCQPFSFIFLDEPVSHLDETNNRIVAEMVAEEAERQGAGVIATSVGNHLLLPGAQFVDL